MPTENKVEKASTAVTITAVATLLTALGGLIYALKSPNPVINQPAVDPKPFVDTVKNNTTKIFYGKVGKLDTTFNLTFEKNSTSVHGTYYYNKRQDQLYQLSGIAMNGDLHLNEFTKKISTAKCVLKKDANGCFVGKMFNDDGKIFNMSICE